MFDGCADSENVLGRENSKFRLFANKSSRPPLGLEGKEKDV